MAISFFLFVGFIVVIMTIIVLAKGITDRMTHASESMREKVTTLEKRVHELEEQNRKNT